MTSTSETPNRPPDVKPGAPLPASALYTASVPDRFDFEVTDEVDDTDPMLGQARATEALQFGVGIRSDGYNVFALGSRETDKDRLIRYLLDEQASKDALPSDWCYVFNFDDPRKPKVLQMPPGTSTDFQADMGKFIEELQTGLSAAFESEEYQTRRQVLEEEVRKEHDEALTDLQQQAQQRSIALLRTPTGFLFVPVKEGEVVPPKELENVPEDVRRQWEADIKQLQEELLHILRQVPSLQRKLRDRLRTLNREVASYAVHDLINELSAKYGTVPQVKEHLEAVEKDIVENVGNLLRAAETAPEGTAPHLPGEQEALLRYYVNALVTHPDVQQAPVVYEDHPTLQNLMGRVEYRSQMGVLVTDYTLLQPGALHRANGGYLMLDARRVLLQPLAWEALKRTLRSGELRIQSPYEEMGLATTVSLEPEPIPLQIKVVLLGDRWLYYMLHAADPEFTELFRVEADFDDRMDRTEENEMRYAHLIGWLARQGGLRPLDRHAVARVLEHSARMADDAEKLSTETQTIRNLLREADYWAGREHRERITRDDVEQALEARQRRAGRLRRRLQEHILRKTLLVDTDGAAVGQINGLSVVQLGQDTFGHPSRITARVRLGAGNVIDIEREVELGGPIHSKGVLILSGFLGARYAADKPLSLSASLVFEQSYGGVEGDSASAAELFALLSAVAEVPLRQDLAVTGSVNQHGQIQPIGGVNEKIEGFFDICRARGLTGTHGVVIPASNVKNLMLRREVVEAAEKGLFNLFAIETIDQGMELLTGRPMGTRREDGTYPEHSINDRVLQRLHGFAEARRAFVMTTDGARHEDRTP